MPPSEPTPVSTPVLIFEEITPIPTTPIDATATPLPDEARGLVVEVIDGQTIAVVMEGDPTSRAYLVRYIGIEAPPPADPWGAVAYQANRKNVNLKVVRLVRDQTNFNDDGYLMRYVYLGDELMSIILVEQGLARAEMVEPDTAFETEIEQAERQARQGSLGLWSGRPPTPTLTPVRSQATETGQPAGVEPTATSALTATATLTVTVAATDTPAPTATEPTTPEATPTEAEAEAEELQGPQ